MTTLAAFQLPTNYVLIALPAGVTIAIVSVFFVRRRRRGPSRDL